MACDQAAPGPHSDCVMLAVEGLGLPVTAGPSALPWSGGPTAGSMLVFVAERERLRYLGDLGRSPGGPSTLRSLTRRLLQERLSSPVGALFDVEGYLVINPVHSCYRRDPAATPCPAPEPFLADDPPTAEGILLSSRGSTVDLEPAVAGLDPSRTVTAGHPGDAARACLRLPAGRGCHGLHGRRRSLGGRCPIQPRIARPGPSSRDLRRAHVNSADADIARAVRRRPRPRARAEGAEDARFHAEHPRCVGLVSAAWPSCRTVCRCRGSAAPTTTTLSGPPRARARASRAPTAGRSPTSTSPTCRCSAATPPSPSSASSPSASPRATSSSCRPRIRSSCPRSSDAVTACRCGSTHSRPARRTRRRSASRGSSPVATRS